MLLLLHLHPHLLFLHLHLLFLIVCVCVFLCLRPTRIVAAYATQPIRECSLSRFRPVYSGCLLYRRPVP